MNTTGMSMSTHKQSTSYCKNQQPDLAQTLLLCQQNKGKFLNCTEISDQHGLAAQAHTLRHLGIARHQCRHIRWYHHDPAQSTDWWVAQSAAYSASRIKAKRVKAIPAHQHCIKTTPHASIMNAGLHTTLRRRHLI